MTGLITRLGNSKSYIRLGAERKDEEGCARKIFWRFLNPILASRNHDEEIGSQDAQRRERMECGQAAQFVRCWSNISFEESLQHPTNNASTYKGFNGSIIQIQIMK